ncbi:serpin family protein [bacterium]|nr:MAG: serpin family protein [bacterium]
MRPFVIAPLLCLGACQAVPPSIQIPSAEAKAQVPVAAATLREFGARPTGENLVWSPVSAYVALAMLTEGASGETQGRLSKALDLKSADGLSALLSALSSSEVTIADAVFVRSDLKAAPAFSDRTGRLYAAEALPLQGLEQVNGWVAKKTKDRIPKLFDKIDPNDAAVLVNAVTFDGRWAKPFEVSATKERDFKAVSGTVKVPIMAAKRRMLYGEKDGTKMIVLPYEGGNYEMVAWLPPIGQKPDPYGDLGAWMKLVKNREVDVWLPKWELRKRHDLKPMLSNIGLGSLFEKADFSCLVPSGELDHISQAVQEAWIQVDEAGTKAAAATGVMMATASMTFDPDGPVEFHADRPFAYAIVHSSTRTPLFLGTVDNPKG